MTSPRRNGGNKTAPILARVHIDGDTARVQAIIPHPMENGGRTNPLTGEPIPAHFITEVAFRKGDQVLLRADWSRAVSRNPYLAFRTTALRRGDVLDVVWRDNLGDNDRLRMTVE